jgi:tetratricopeptide (TPR) repeat protein
MRSLAICFALLQNPAADQLQQTLVLIRSGQIAEAEHRINVFQVPEQRYQLWYQVAGAYFLQERLIDAERAVKEALAIQETADAQNLLGATYDQLDFFAKSELAFRRAIELKPSLASARFNYGVSLLRQSKYKEAVVQFRATSAIAPQNKDAWKHLATALLESGSHTRTSERPQKRDRMRKRPSSATARAWKLWRSSQNLISKPAGLTMRESGLLSFAPCIPLTPVHDICSHPFSFEKVQRQSAYRFLTS